MSKSTTNTFLPELANILARFNVVNVLPSPGCMEVIRNDLNALSNLNHYSLKNSWRSELPLAILQMYP